MSITPFLAVSPSSRQDLVRRHFKARGYRVLNVPESATVLLSGGFSPADDPLIFQESILDLQLAVEKTFNRQAAAFASRGELVVVLLDRGLLDGAAYMERAEWLNMLDRKGLDEVTAHSIQDTATANCTLHIPLCTFKISLH